MEQRRDESSKLTAQLTQLRNDARELHDQLLLELQISAAAKIDGELKEKILTFTKELDTKKEMASLYVLQLFNSKVTEMDNAESKIINCLEFSTNGCVEAAERAILNDEFKLKEMATQFLDEVNRFYCHKIDSFVLDPKCVMNSNLEAVQHAKGQFYWSEQLVNAAKEWDSPHGARRSCLHQVCDQKVATHEQDILTYVDDQLKVAFALMCDELKVAILNIIANCRVESLRIRDMAMSDFHLVMKEVKDIVQKIDSCAGSNVTALRTSSYVLSQAHEQAKVFAKTVTEACDLYIANIIMASRMCVMREIENRNYTEGSLKEQLLSVLAEIK